MMSFDPKITEARLALDLILTTDMPNLAWEALEAGLDGPAIRRLAALEFPTIFQVREILPHAMEEMHLVKVSEAEAALYLAKIRAQEVLRSDSDPLKHLRDFEHLWIRADYCHELAEYGNLDDEVYVARYMNQPEPEIREWVTEKLKKLADA
jgi:hypothetical protein